MQMCVHRRSHWCIRFKWLHNIYVPSRLQVRLHNESLELKEDTWWHTTKINSHSGSLKVHVVLHVISYAEITHIMLMLFFPIYLHFNFSGNKYYVISLKKNMNVQKCCIAFANEKHNWLTKTDHISAFVNNCIPSFLYFNYIFDHLAVNI